jgi:hypothetical protein
MREEQQGQLAAGEDFPDFTTDFDPADLTHLSLVENHEVGPDLLDALNHASRSVDAGDVIPAPFQNARGELGQVYVCAGE